MKTITYQPPTELSTLNVIPSARLNLARIPTPIQPLPNILPDTIDLWIKRDDLTGVTLSGNKIRKLDFLLADALTTNCDTTITCGGIQSNHCRSTAIASCEAGLDSHIFLNTPEPNNDPGLTGNLLLDRLVNTQMHLITFDQYLQRDTLMSNLADELRNAGRTPYIIPEGGSSPLGVWGYIDSACELATQMKDLSLNFDDIVVACGSSGTVTGLAIAVTLLNLPIKVHAVNVCWDAANFYQRINILFEQLGFDHAAEDIIDIMDGYVGAGYAQSQPEELELLCSIARTSGIILDPVYTIKAFNGLKHELENNPDRFKGKRILFIHTGGLFGLYDKLNDIEPIFK